MNLRLPTNESVLGPKNKNGRAPEEGWQALEGEGALPCTMKPHLSAADAM